MNKDYLRVNFDKYNIKYDESRIDGVLDFMKVTLTTNELFNLTAITNEDEFLEKMILDSALVLSGNDLSNKTVIDVGTGAGYPGMVLKILNSTIDIHLLDSTRKKVDFIQKFADDHDIKISTHALRAEMFSRMYPEFFDIALARAVASLPVLLEIIAPMIKVGGEFIAMKGPSFDLEIAQSKNALDKLGMEVTDIQLFELPNCHEQRALIHIKKNKPTNKKYPRPYKDIKAKTL